MKNVLTIAGSDPSSGAGIQSDVKTFAELGCHGLTAVTAITSQNTSQFSKIEPVSAKMVSSQIDSVISDFKIDAVKIGMVFSLPIIKVIYKKISRMDVPVIVDPVLRSTTGGALLQKNAIPGYKKLIVPMAAAITPNAEELGILSGKKIRKHTDVEPAADILRELGAKSVIVTGQSAGKKIKDSIFVKDKHFFLWSKKIPIKNHGSGCNYSAALTASIAKGSDVMRSAVIAKNFTYNSIKNASRPGKGIHVTRHKTDKSVKVLKDAIDELVMMRNIATHIPECQTNFVFAGTRPKSQGKILGLDGRIVRAGKSAIVAGEIVPGGSRHVASAVLQMSKKFPGIRSGINIRYDAKTIQKLEKNSMRVTSYDRKNEPSSVKNKENHSIVWGIKDAIRDSKTPYDAVYHTGDEGKEPMIIIFGNSPDDVLKKVARII